MTSFVTRIASVAAIALAALPIVAVGAAHAETRTAVVKVADLDFARTTDIAKFERRVSAVQSRLCGGRSDIRATIACEKDVRQQALGGLGYAQTSRMIAATAPAKAYNTAAN